MTAHPASDERAGLVADGRDALVKILIDMQRLIILGRDAEVADALRTLNAALTAPQSAAERYAWLRTHFRFANDSMQEIWFDPNIDLAGATGAYEPEELDAEIDRLRAIGESGGQSDHLIVQACRKGDRDMLASDAGKELLRKAADALSDFQPTTDDVRAALLFCLWHHQGGNSKIGQPIRLMLGIGQDEHLTDEQLAIAKSAQSALALSPPSAPALNVGEEVVPDDLEWVVQYRPKDGSGRWTNMAAYDFEMVAANYVKDCGKDDVPWEYRYIRRASPAASREGVVVPREPLILELWRGDRNSTNPKREIIAYVDALLSAISKAYSAPAKHGAASAEGG